MQHPTSPQIRIRPSTHRKPVPPYIPSPASSSLMDITFGEISSKPPPYAQNDDTYPPLPDDWEDRVKNALVSRADENPLFGSALAGSTMNGVAKPRPIRQSMSLGGINHSAAYAPVQRPSRQKPHQEYRPPTPPLPGSRRQTGQAVPTPPLARSVTNTTNSSMLSPLDLRRAIITADSSHTSVDTAFVARGHHVPHIASMGQLTKLPHPTVVHEIHLDPRKLHRRTQAQRAGGEKSCSRRRDARHLELSEKTEGVPSNELPSWRQCMDSLGLRCRSRFRRLGVAVGAVFR
ncbi:hypothetical protein HGRIS_009542 [Hohenbuehelia grisea]|uniref:Uncharacterized protein n=1 Tax=Hohenbuehelia grisea TaxID=104357 RepID=A0ABR3J1L5_9AGAR